jgi:O-antigen ligase
MSALTDRLRIGGRPRSWETWLIVIATLALAFLFGTRASPSWFWLLAVGIGFVILLIRPELGILALSLVALFGPYRIGTGSDVSINPTTLLIPILTAAWILSMVVHRRIEWVQSRINPPMFLFLVSGALSLVIGMAIWDPFVPRAGSFILVQLAQWGLFAFSALALWLTGNLIRDEAWLRRLTFLFLIAATLVALIRSIGMADDFAARYLTFASQRAPFWVVLTAMAGGQLLFNRSLAPAARVFLAGAIGIAIIYSFFLYRDLASYWIGVSAAIAVLIWLRLGRGRWLLIAMLAALVISGQLLPSIYNFAGGEREWTVSGGSRLALTQRVIEVTRRNPVTGLGPAAYRPYARMKPLPYGEAFWVSPNVSSHNNYVDIFAHQGLVGLALFAWFSVEFIWLGLRLRKRFTEGFASGYVNGVLAAFASSLVIMMLADWLLPFVYNIGFLGFQSGVLVWMFMGGLLTLEAIAQRTGAADGSG